MRKKGKIILVVVILIVVAIVGFVIYSKNKNKNVDLVNELFSKIEKAEKYSFIMELNSKNKTSIIKRNNETAIDRISETDGHSTTIVKEDTTYYILHDKEEYYVYTGNNIEQTILLDGIAEVKDKEYTKGTEKVRGKNCTYQEYDGITSFFPMLITANFEEETCKTRFYFDKNNNIAFIKTIYGEEEELLKIEITDEINDSLFEIPSSYAEG